jgi:hypothetical protein
LLSCWIQDSLDSFCYPARYVQDCWIVEKYPVRFMVLLSKYIRFRPYKFKVNPLSGDVQAFSQGPKRGRPILVQQCIYSKGGGLRKRSSGKPLKFTLLHVSISSKLVRNFSNTLGFVSLCRYASLLNYDIFIQPVSPSN